MRTKYAVFLIIYGILMVIHGGKTAAVGCLYTKM